MVRVVVCFVSGILALAGCGAPPAPRPVAHPIDGFLVWEDADGPRTTWYDAQGRTQGVAAGIWIADEHRLVRLRVLRSAPEVRCGPQRRAAHVSIETLEIEPGPNVPLIASKLS